MPRFNSFTAADLHEALPDVQSTMHLEGLAQPVVVRRDEWGIPHIAAGNAADLFFAQGFVTAQDRLWHMDYDRHRALGRWAEWVGADGVGEDLLMRAAGMGRTARLDYDMSGADARQMMDAYSAGVNSFIETTKSLPIEYTILGTRPEPWEAWHCPTVYKMRNTLLGTYEGKLFRSRMVVAGAAASLARLTKGYPGGHLLTVPPGAEFHGDRLDGLDDLERLLGDVEELGGGATNAELWEAAVIDVDAGSNAWAISGDYTESGLPLVAGDSHRGLDTPSVYYQIHLSCPEFSAIGSSVPGMAGVLHFCHNDHVAWGMTFGAADTQDLYLERFRDAPASGRQYEFAGGWREAQVLDEEILVRDGETLKMEVTVTHHGPVIAGEPAAGWGVTISDPGLIGGSSWPDAALNAMRCRSVAELHGAFGKWTDRVNNYAVADVSGTFGYLHEGRIPVRDDANGWCAVAGWRGDSEWRGYIPHDDLPKAIDPAAGYAVTCNQRVVDESYPYFVGLSPYAGYRARRVQEGIRALNRGATVPLDMAAIHGDRLSQPAQVFRDALIEAVGDGSSIDSAAATALELLRRWDCSMDRDLVAPTIYIGLRKKLVARIAEFLFADQAELVVGDIIPGGSAHERLIGLEITLALESGENDLLPPGDSWDQTLRNCFAAALKELRQRLGEDPGEWRWGRVHRTTPRHPLSRWLSDEFACQLDPPSLAVHGDGDTPLASGFTHTTFSACTMSVNRYIHDPSDWSRSLWIVPLGASGHPASHHYADQAQLWADVEYIPQLWKKADIEERAETTQLLEPRQ